MAEQIKRKVPIQWIQTIKEDGTYEFTPDPNVYSTQKNVPSTSKIDLQNILIDGTDPTQPLSSSYATSASYAESSSFALTASFFSGSVSNAVSASYAQTASFVQTAQTASYLNTLNQDLTFNGNLTLNGTASISYLNVAYESASVIYSSGSNQFGDASNDTQTLYGSVIVPTGSLTVTGSTISTGGFTGSLQGTATTASFVLNAVSSSFASTASFVQNAQTASYIETAQTASYVQNAQTASYVQNAQTASFVLSSSFASTAQTASYVLNAVSSSFASTASFIQTAQTASYVLNAVSSSFASTASFISGTILGSGTVGSISKFTSATEIGNATVDVDYLQQDMQVVAAQGMGSSVKGYTIASPIIGSFTQAITFNTNTANSGEIRWIAVWIPKTTTVTGVKWYQSTAGSYTANNYNGVGLYSHSGGTLTKVASSTDDGTIWKATASTVGNKAFTSTYSASPGLYYIAAIYCYSAQVTAPGLAGTGTLAAGAVFNSYDFTNSNKLAGYTSAQTSLPNTQALSGITVAVARMSFYLY